MQLLADVDRVRGADTVPSGEIPIVHSGAPSNAVQGIGGLYAIDRAADDTLAGAPIARFRTAFDRRFPRLGTATENQSDHADPTGDSQRSRSIQAPVPWNTVLVRLT